MKPKQLEPFRRAIPVVLPLLLAVCSAGGAAARAPAAEIPTAVPAQAPGPLFTDVTEEAGVDFVHDFGDSELSNLVESTGVGVCLLDYDGDERLDLYFVQGSRAEGVTDPEELEARAQAGDRAALPSNRLYRNVTEPGGPWRFEDVTAATGVGDTGYGMGCVAGDLDNDGDPDLVVTNYGPNRVYRNDRDEGLFTDVTERAGLGDPAWSLGAALLDYDGDGLLDLYVGNYVVFDPDYRAFYVADRFPGPLAYPGSPDRLYRNLGGWRFEDVTAEAGIGNPEGRAMGVGVTDYDGDGRPDVFVANDAMANSLFRNRGDGSFEDVALPAGVAFSANGDATAAMGADFGDVDGDGRFEILVPDMTFSTLYQPLEGLVYEDRSRRWGLAPAAAQYVAWSGHFLDYDLDGRLDLFLTTGDLHELEPMEELLLRNVGPGELRDVSMEAGEAFLRPTVGRGAAVGDLDADGDPDIVLNVLGDRAVLLRNDTGGANHWLAVRTVGTASNRDGVGALVEVETGSGEGALRQRREVRAGCGYLSSSDPRALFGLGRAGRATVTVRWPSGTVTVREDVPAGRVLTVEEGP